MVQPQDAPEPSDPASSDAKNKAAKPATAPTPKGYAHLLKYVIVGDSGTGKTSLVRRFCKGEFHNVKNYTIGVDFDIKTIALPNGDDVKLQLWDTAGQERYRTITTSYYRGANGVVIVYDVNNPESVTNVPRWVQEVQRYCNDDAVIIIIGAKTDLLLEGGEEESPVFVEQLVSDGVAFGAYRASAKTGDGVSEAFEALTQELISRRLNERNPLRGMRKPSSSSSGQGHDAVHLGEVRGKKAAKKGCC